MIIIVVHRNYDIMITKRSSNIFYIIQYPATIAFLPEIYVSISVNFCSTAVTTAFSIKRSSISFKMLRDIEKIGTLMEDQRDSYRR